LSHNRFEALSDTNATFQSSYDALLEFVEAVATTTLGITRRHKAKPWISDSTSELLERRDAAMNIFLASSKQDKQRAAKMNNYDRLAKAAKKSLQDDEIKSLEDELKGMQLAAAKGETSDMWEKCSSMSKFLPPPQIMICKKSSHYIILFFFVLHYKTHKLNFIFCI
jgi:hypothetical protein